MAWPKSTREELEKVEEIWAQDLLHIPTYYGRLVYLAGLRNPDTGKYEHLGSSHANRALANRTLKSTHEALFNEWVRHPLERKKKDVEAYISGLDQVDHSDLIDAWLRLTPYKNLVPATIQGPERQRHISDLEAILGLLRNVYGVASPDRSA